MTASNNDATPTHQIAENIVSRLPRFYRALEKNSLAYGMVFGIAKTISEQKKDLNRILQSHWVRTAQGKDLELLASILGLSRKPDESDEHFRVRIESTLGYFHRGGTVEAVRSQLAVFLASSVDDIAIVENPLVEQSIEMNMISGDEWRTIGNSVTDEPLSISLTVKDGEAREPAIIDKNANLVIHYNDVLKKGEMLEIREGKATIDGTADVTSKIVIEDYERLDDPPQATSKIEGLSKQSRSFTPDMPKIPRKETEWVYRERLSDSIARFDKQSKFDEGVYFKDVPPTTIRFAWNAHLAAAFQVRVSSDLLARNNVSDSELEHLVNSIKAVGVHAFVTPVKEPQSQSANAGRSYDSGDGRSVLTPSGSLQKNTTIAAQSVEDGDLVTADSSSTAKRQAKTGGKM